MLVLGRHSDDKGRQLEALTKRILEHRGYQNVVCNYISSGGEEIDVRAVLPTPGVAAAYPVTMICECKAYRSPVAMSDWLKFLGKIFVEEAKGSRTAGTFIALSGVNGYVSGNYEDVRARRADVMLVTGTELRTAIQEIFGIPDLERITRLVGRSTARPIRHIEEAYYEGRVYWVIAFEETDYTLLTADGKAPPDAELEVVQPLLLSVIEATEYVNIEEEQDALRRRNVLAKAVLAHFLIHGSAPDPGGLEHSVIGVTTDEVAEAMDALKSQNWLAKVDNEETSLAFSREAPLVADMYRFLLAGPTPRQVVDLFASATHAELVRDSILPEVLETHQVHLSEEEQCDVLRILSWSPSALAWALNPDPWMVNSAPSEEWHPDQRRKLDRTRATYFLRELYRRLQADFRHTATRSLFLKAHGIEKIETTERVVVHGRDGVEIDHTLQERMRLGILEEGFVGPDGSDVVNLIELDPTDDRLSPEEA